MFEKSIAIITCAAFAHVVFCERPDPQKREREALSQGDRAIQSKAKIAIVTISKKPVDIGSWITYHLKHVGIEHLYLQVEETPWLSKYIEDLPAELKERITYWEGAPSPDQDFTGRPHFGYNTLMFLQRDAMIKAKSLALTTGYDWLLHIDDDELLYARDLHNSLAKAPNSIIQITVPNVEAVYSADVKDCFRETRKAVTNPKAYSAYANGKSFIRPTATLFTQGYGPHRWGAARSQSLKWNLTTDAAMILHYESCPFEAWLSKFWRLSSLSPDELLRIPFSYYRESINLMNHCRKFHLSNFNDPDAPADCRRDHFHRVWARYKTLENPKFKEENVIQISIPWDSM